MSERDVQKNLLRRFAVGRGDRDGPHLLGLASEEFETVAASLSRKARQFALARRRFLLHLQLAKRKPPLAFELVISELPGGFYNPTELLLCSRKSELPARVPAGSRRFDSSFLNCDRQPHSGV